MNKLVYKIFSVTQSTKHKTMQKKATVVMHTVRQYKAVKGSKGVRLQFQSNKGDTTTLQVSNQTNADLDLQ